MAPLDGPLWSVAGRLAAAPRRDRHGRRVRAARAVRARDDLDRHVHRPLREQPVDGRHRHVQLAVPDDVPGQHVRTHSGPAGLAAPGRRLEPDERHRGGEPVPVRQPQPGKPSIDWDDTGAKDALVSALVNDATASRSAFAMRYAARLLPYTRSPPVATPPNPFTDAEKSQARPLGCSPDPPGR